MNITSIFGNETFFNASGLSSIFGSCGSAWIGLLVTGALFIGSEVLPFVKKTKNNGLVHGVISFLKK